MMPKRTNHAIRCKERLAVRKLTQQVSLADQGGDGVGFIRCQKTGHELFHFPLHLPRFYGEDGARDEPLGLLGDEGEICVRC